MSKFITQSTLHAASSYVAVATDSICAEPTMRNITDNLMSLCARGSLAGITVVLDALRVPLQTDTIFDLLQCASDNNYPDIVIYLICSSHMMLTTATIIDFCRRARAAGNTKLYARLIMYSAPQYVNLDLLVPIMTTHIDKLEALRKRRGEPIDMRHNKVRVLDLNDDGEYDYVCIHN